jgi:hypothetical protein
MANYCRAVTKSPRGTPPIAHVSDPYFVSACNLSLLVYTKVMYLTPTISLLATLLIPSILPPSASALVSPFELSNFDARNFDATSPTVSAHTIFRFDYVYAVLVSSSNFVSIYPCVRSLSIDQTLNVSTYILCLGCKFNSTFLLRVSDYMPKGGRFDNKLYVYVYVYESRSGFFN